MPVRVQVPSEAQDYILAHKGAATKSNFVAAPLCALEIFFLFVIEDYKNKNHYCECP